MRTQNKVFTSLLLFILCILLLSGILSCTTNNKVAKEVAKDTKGTTNLKKESIPQALVPPEFEVPKNGYLKSTTIDYGEKRAIEYFSTTTGKNRKAFIILPAGYSTDIKYPVMYLLHGIGGTEHEWFYGKPQEIIGNLIGTGQTVPFITVVPNIRARENDTDTSDIFSESNINAFHNFINDLKNDLMPYIAENFSISQERKDTAICGLSMGGMESLSIGFTLIDTFGWIGAFSPAPTLDTRLLTLADKTSTPFLVFICNGDSDSVVQDIPKTYHQILETNGVKHIWYEYHNEDHNFTVWNHGLYNFTKLIFK